MPSRASTDTVNAVSNGDSFLAAIRSSPSSSQRSGVSARQISPRPSLAMKLIASGVANWAASVEVALVLAVLVVADDDHAPGADLLERLLDGRERPAHAISFSTYLASTSTSRFTGRPGSAVPSVVRSSVSGIRDTENESASIAETVSDTPSTAIEPFSTT